MEEPNIPVHPVDLLALAERTLAIVRKNRLDLEGDLARMLILHKGQVARGDKLMNRLEKMRDFFCEMRVYLRKTHKKCKNKKGCGACQLLLGCEKTLQEFRWE